MAFTNLVNEVWADDQYRTAEAIAVRLKLTDEQREYLLPVIVNSARIVRRQSSRRAEENYDPESRKPTMRGSQKQEDLSDDPRLAFLAAEFALPDGRWVSWRDATVKDHEDRIVMLDKQRGSIVVTIDKHRAVVQQIKSNKVRCLGDLYPTSKSVAA